MASVIEKVILPEQNNRCTGGALWRELKISPADFSEAAPRADA